MKAQVKWVKIQAAVTLKEGATSIGPISIEQRLELPDGKCFITCEAPVLVVPIELIENDGFVAVEFLKHIELSEGKLWGQYGPFRDQDDLRCHLIAPVLDATKEELMIYDWRVKEWQTEKSLL